MAISGIVAGYTLNITYLQPYLKKKNLEQIEETYKKNLIEKNKQDKQRMDSVIKESQKIGIENFLKNNNFIEKEDDVHLEKAKKK